MSPRPRWPYRRRSPAGEPPPGFVEPPPPEPTVPLAPVGPPPPGAPPPYAGEIVGPPGPPPEEPPPERALWPWLLLLGIVVVAGLAIAWAVSRGNDHNKTVVLIRVPAVVGQPERQAVATLTRAGLRSAVTRASDRRPAGTVLNESPPAGSTVRRSSIVRLTVSNGPRAPATVRVPNVVGLASTRATNALSAAGLRPETKTAASDKPADTVVAQAPAAGAEVVRNSVVTVTVSNGPSKVGVPDVVGKSEADARATLKSAGLLASIFRVTAPRPPGTVIAQFPKAGAQVAKGSRVRINVSRGAPPPTTTGRTTTAVTATTVTTTTATATTVTATTATTTAPTTTARTTTAPPPPATATVPDVVGKSQTQARHALKDVGLVAAVAYVHANVTFDEVVAQFPKPGATLKQGSRVRINVSLGPKPKPQSTVPDVTSTDEASAKQQLTQAGFKVESVPRDTTDPSEDGVVVDQDPAGGTKAPDGSTVTIYVGNYTGA